MSTLFTLDKVQDPCKRSHRRRILRSWRGKGHLDFGHGHGQSIPEVKSIRLGDQLRARERSVKDNAAVSNMSRKVESEAEAASLSQRTQGRGGLA